MTEEKRAFFTVKEFAVRLGIHQNTVRRLIKNGRINAFRIGGGKKSGYRIPENEINRIALFDLEEVVKKIIEDKNKT